PILRSAKLVNSLRDFNSLLEKLLSLIFRETPDLFKEFKNFKSVKRLPLTSNHFILGQFSITRSLRLQFEISHSSSFVKFLRITLFILSKFFQYKLDRKS